MARLTASAAQLGFTLDLAHVRDALAANAETWGPDDRRVRLVLARDGVIAITAQPVAPPSTQTLTVGVTAVVLDAGDPFLRHKTTRRDAYEQAFAEAVAQGCDEALLLNRDGAVADASRNCVFLPRDGVLVTPPLSAGALQGVLRAELITEGQAMEGEISLDDLRRARTWFLGNSLHGLRPARLAAQWFGASMGVL